MSLIRLQDGTKFEIDQPNEGDGILRNRKRRIVKITFRANEDQFDAVRTAITPDNLETFSVYYPDNETANEPDEQLIDVSNKVFEGYTLIGDWEDKEVEVQQETSRTPAVYGRQLSVTLGERLASDT